MYKADVIAFFGSQKATGDALGISQAAVSKWGDIVPVPRQGHVRLAMEAEEKARADRDKKEARKQSRKKIDAYQDI